jgi:hypothetical protein
MRYISYVWTGQGLLIETLRKPFDHLAVWLDVIRRPISLRLGHTYDCDTLIQSRAHTIAVQSEVGALEFSKSEKPFESELVVKVPKSFGAVVAIEKLIIEERDVRVETGIVFKNDKNEEIVIASSVQPFGLAIKVPWASQMPKFTPQYDLDQYQRISMGASRTE